MCHFALCPSSCYSVHTWCPHLCSINLGVIAIGESYSCNATDVMTASPAPAGPSTNQEDEMWSAPWSVCSMITMPVLTSNSGPFCWMLTAFHIDTSINTLALHIAVPSTLSTPLALSLDLELTSNGHDFWHHVSFSWQPLTALTPGLPLQPCGSILDVPISRRTISITNAHHPPSHPFACWLFYDPCLCDTIFSHLLGSWGAYYTNYTHIAYGLLAPCFLLFLCWPFNNVFGYDRSVLIDIWFRALICLPFPTCVNLSDWLSPLWFTRAFFFLHGYIPSQWLDSWRVLANGWFFANDCFAQWGVLANDCVSWMTLSMVCWSSCSCPDWQPSCSCPDHLSSNLHSSWGALIPNDFSPWGEWDMDIDSWGGWTHPVHHLRL